MALLATVPNNPGMGTERVPLVVNLDGTLLRTNSLIESILPLVRMKPWTLLALPFWRLKGRAYLKHRVAAAATLDIHGLPFRTEVVEFLREQKMQGRPLILATGADEKLAAEINGELGLFDAVMASDGRINLIGENKRERLVTSFGPQGFDYIGNDRRDAVWGAARRALLASDSPGFAKSIQKIRPVETIFKEPSARWQDYLDALRPTHWVKNALLFVPLAAAHRVFELGRLEHVALAFIAFDLCASGIYLLNDLLDLPADRRHPHKNERMLASGRIPLTYALFMMPLLLLGAFGLALHLSIVFAGVMGLYTALMIVYSMKLKDIPLVDVFVLAGGYALRVAAGAGGSAAADFRLAPDALHVSVFQPGAHQALRGAHRAGGSANGRARARARGYLSGDKAMLVAQGIASGYLAVMVLALYTNTEISQRLYARHDVFWGVCLLLLYWVSYVWMAALRGRIVGDPVMFALSDRVSRWTIAGMALLAALSL